MPSSDFEYVRVARVNLALRGVHGRVPGQDVKDVGVHILRPRVTHVCRDIYKT